MIARLAGRLVEKLPSRVVVDVNGIGYEVHVPLSTFYGLGDPGADVALRVHTHVREDALLLFGFATALEQLLFERLIAISGIGPKVALSVLSGIEPPDLVRAVRTNDVARLTAIPGVGKKTAERIVLEMKDRLPALADEGAAVGTETGMAGDLRDDVLSALLNLGYQRPVAERAVASAIKSSGRTFEETLRSALREIAR